MHTIGHKDILQFFEKAITIGRLHHAYLFVGRSQLGKRTIAEYIAKQLFNASEKSLVTNPDFFFLQRGVDEKTGKTKKHISIEQVHELRHFLQGKPFFHKKKVAIINDAELLNRSAMNALLKTLEEPRGDTTVFLIATDELALLETIRSRCQSIYFYPVSTEIIDTFLQSTGIDVNVTKAMARHASGLPGRAIDWADDVEKYEWYLKERERFQGLFGQPLYKQTASVEDLFGKKEDHIETRTTLRDILDIWQLVIRDDYTQYDSNFEVRYDIVSTYNAILEAKKGLLQNVHPRMLIEQVLLTISHYET